jgi:2OG-Fe(II) oxygenase superfamily
VFPAYFEEATAAMLLDRLDAATAWKLHEESFFKQWEHRLVAPAGDSDIVSKDLLIGARNSVEAALNAQLSPAMAVDAHCLRPGQSVGLHTDDPANPKSRGMTHRLVVHLNRHWSEDCGGQLVFFGSRDPRDARQVFPALHNYAMAFGLSSKSYHAVTEVHSGLRYTMVFSILEKRFRLTRA